MAEDPGKKLKEAIMHNPRIIFILIFLSYFFAGCSVNKKISKQADRLLFSNNPIVKAHIGISIYEPATGKYLYQNNDEKYFIPASNMKLFTLYAGLKYLSDSIPGLEILSSDSAVIINGMGDPTLLHPDFKLQPVFDFLLKENKPLWYTESKFKTTGLGSGWSWDDFSESYLNERSELPVFGNNVTFYGNQAILKIIPGKAVEKLYREGNQISFTSAKRDLHNNIFRLIPGNGRVILTPFITSLPLSMDILSDTLKKTIRMLQGDQDLSKYKRQMIYSRYSDSLFVPMMHNSDNFFAEQTLQMISRLKFGYFNESHLIDSILKNDLAKLPQPIRWVDGSGLSRYNLVTPKDFIFLLEKMKTEFGMERMKLILPTGGEGTLRNYYSSSSGNIYAKTGTLSNNCSLSGYIITKKNKLLIFSVMANNFYGPATPVRRSVEKFLEEIRNKN